MTNHNSSIPFRIRKYLPVFFLFLFLFSTYPYVFNCFLGIPSETIVILVSFCVFLGLLFVSQKKKTLPLPITFILCIQVFFWLFFSLYHQDTTYLTRVFYLTLTYIILCVLYCRNQISAFISANNIIITIQAVLGVVAFILVFLNIWDAAFEFVNIDGRNSQNYILTCSNTYMGNFIRISGYFDEPGALANWGVFALLFNKVFFNNRKIEVLLLLSLVFTFSAAYFVQAALYLMCFGFEGKKAWVYMLFLLLLLFLIYDLIGSSEEFQYMTFDRFEGGSIRSDRVELAAIAKKYFLQSPIMGIGARHATEIAYMGDNQYEILAKDGIVGFIVTYLPLCYIFLHYITIKKIVLSCVILSLGYFQRPFHIDGMHYLMLYIFFLMTFLSFSRNERVSR